nr:hypothetical protein B0A51_17395 [Rachicladosporium sp. CCFEE 5018]
MAAKSPVVLILGAGPNIGAGVAKAFAAKGYNIGLAARSVKSSEDTDTQINIPADFSKTEDVVNAFDVVKKKFGIPHVVVYNVSVAHFTPADDPFALSLADLRADNEVNIFGAFVAAQQAVQGFAQLPSSAARAFITTGNVLNVAVLPKFLSQNVGKSGASGIIATAAEAYAGKGYKFYYADERKPDGAPKYRVDGEAHGKLYYELARGEKQGPWHQTFVAGQGYTEFENSRL